MGQNRTSQTLLFFFLEATFFWKFVCGVEGGTTVGEAQQVNACVHVCMCVCTFRCVCTECSSRAPATRSTLIFVANGAVVVQSLLHENIRAYTMCTTTCAATIWVKNFISGIVFLNNFSQTSARDGRIFRIRFY